MIPHYCFTEQDDRLIRPKIDSTNDPTKVTNTKNTEDTNIYYSYCGQWSIRECVDLVRYDS